MKQPHVGTHIYQTAETSPLEPASHGTVNAREHRTKIHVEQTATRQLNSNVTGTQTTAQMLSTAPALLLTFSLILMPHTTAGTCFPGFSNECCSAISLANTNPSLHNALIAVMEASGSAEAKAFSQCTATLSPCKVVLPNQTNPPAMCCTADALDGWTLPGPAAALRALSAAGDGVSGGGNIWWVNINQTDTTTMAPFVAQKNVRHQYPNWYPSACSNTTAIGYEQSMMCHGGAVIECRATAEKAV